MAGGIRVVMAVVAAIAMLPGPLAATAAIDLAEILAGPPSPDYSEITSGGPVITGPFDSHEYAQWLASTGADVAGIQAAYEQHGFTRGYGRSWVAISSTKATPGTSRRNYLVETVEEYSSATGAQWRFQGLQAYARNGGDDFVREIQTPLANSFGAVAFSGWEYYVVFAKGNDVYIVRFDSDTDDMTASVLQQAEAQEEIAPDYTIAPANWVATGSPTSAPTGPSTGDYLKFAFFILIVVARGVTFVAGLLRRRPG